MADAPINPYDLMPFTIAVRDRSWWRRYRDRRTGRYVSSAAWNTATRMIPTSVWDAWRLYCLEQTIGEHNRALARLVEEFCA